LEIPPEDQIIYEMHVRSFTRHPSSGVKHPVHLPSAKKSLPERVGVNCVELMPVYEFDEFENSRPNPETGKCY